MLIVGSGCSRATKVAQDMKPTIDTYLGSPIEEESEKDFLSKLISDLRSRGEDAVVLANFHAGRLQLQVDFLVITSKCVCHVELKNYTRPIEGTYNGPWKLRMPDGKVTPVGDKNRYHQAKSCKFAISDELHALVKKDSSLPDIPSGKKFYQFIESVVCVFPEILPGSSIDKTDNKVRIKSYTDLAPFLITQNRNPGWRREHWIKFAMHLGLVRHEPSTELLEREPIKARKTVEEYSKRLSEMVGSNLHPPVPTKIHTKEGLIESSQLLDLFSKGIHCLVLGKSGTGKTHLLKHMALGAIRDNVLPILARAKSSAHGGTRRK
jgi:nuclease-like protein